MSRDDRFTRFQSVLGRPELFASSRPATRCAVIATLLVLLALGLTGCEKRAASEAKPLANSAVDCAYLRCVLHRDPGTFVICLRNNGASPLQFRQVLIDKTPMPVWGIDWTIANSRDFANVALGPTGDDNGERTAAKGDAPNGSVGFKPLSPAGRALQQVGESSVVWARLTPSVIPAGGIGEFRAKLRAPSNRPQRVVFIPALQGRELIEVTIPPVPSPLVIQTLASAPDMKALYLYVANRSSVPQRIESIEVNGCRLRAFRADGPAIRSGSVGVFHLPLAAPLTPDQSVTVKVASANAQVEERVRVSHWFPLAAERTGQAPAGFGLDAESSGVAPQPAASATDRSMRLPATTGLATPSRNIFDCAMHAYGGDASLSARAIMAKADAIRQESPGALTSQHLCRERPETAYPIFGELTDILRANPSVRGEQETAPQASAEEWVARLTRAAREACEPRLLHAVADTAPFDQATGVATPDELTRRLWIMIGEGAKGILYRHLDWKNATAQTQAATEVIRTFNGTVASIREELTISSPVPWVSEAGGVPVARCWTVASGFQSLFVIVVPRVPQPPTPAALSPQTGEGLTVCLDLPSRLRPAGDLAGLRGTGAAGRTVRLAQKDGRWQVVVPVPRTADVYRLSLNYVEDAPVKAPAR